MDTRDNVQAYINLIKDNICYDHHMKYDDYGKREYYDELFRVICEIVCVNRETVRIAGEEYPYELVKCNRQIMMRSDIKLPQPFASWSNSL